LAVGDRVEINKEGWEIMRMIGELVEGKVVDQQRGERAAGRWWGRIGRRLW
jgi:hypothetical protein